MISLVEFTLLLGEFISRKTKVSAHTYYHHLLIELINFLLKFTPYSDQPLYLEPKVPYS